MSENKFKYTFEAIPQEFIDDIANLSGNAVKIYLILFRLTNGGKAWPSNKELLQLTGIVKTNTLSDAIMELVERGWIGDITNPQAYNHQSQYFLNTARKVNVELLEKRLAKRKSMSEKAKARIALAKSSSNQEDDHLGNTGMPLKSSSNQNGTTDSNQKGNTGSNQNGIRIKNLSNKELNKKELIFSAKNAEKPFFGYSENTAWLLKAMVEADAFSVMLPTKEDNLKEYKKWVAQLNTLVSLGTQEDILKVIPICLYDNFKIEEPAFIYSRLNAQLAQLRQDRAEQQKDNEIWEKSFAPKPEEKEEVYVPMPKHIKERLHMTI